MKELKDTIEGMIDEDYRERFKAEYMQLRIRYERLERLLDGYFNHSLTFEIKTPIDVLVKQKIFMLRYMKILEERATYEGIDLD